MSYVLNRMGRFAKTRLTGGLVAFCAAALFTTGLAAQQDPPVNAVDMVISNATLIDGNGAVLRETGIVIQEGKIKGLIAKGKPVPQAKVHLNAKGKYVIPGLIDTHVHLALDPSMQDDKTAKEFFTKNVAANLSNFLDGGVTTVRSFSDHLDLVLELRESVKSGKVEGPRISLVGSGIAMVNGHPAHTVYGKLTYLRTRATIEASDVASVKKAVDLLASRGVDAIKIFYDGFDSPEKVKFGPDHPDFWGTGPLKRLTPEMLEAAIKQAKSHGLPAFVHVQDEEGAMRAIEFGASGVEHGLSEDPKKASDAFIKKFVSSGASYSGTMQVYEALIPTRLKNAQRHYTHMASAGAKIVVGTDIFGPLHKKGKTAREIELIVASGVSNARAISAATGNAASALGLDATLGFIRTGFTADLVVLNHNPLKNISAVRDQSAVIQSGRIVRLK